MNLIGDILFWLLLLIAIIFLGLSAIVFIFTIKDFKKDTDKEDSS